MDCGFKTCWDFVVKARFHQALFVFSYIEHAEESVGLKKCDALKFNMARLILVETLLKAFFDLYFR